jgi:hypothetical protein
MNPRLFVGALCFAVLGAAPLAAQDTMAKHYAVTSDRALHVTRDVLGEQGFDVVKVEARGGDQTVFYRRGNTGTGRWGRLERLVVRRVENRIVFVDTPEAFLVQIDLRLKL